MRCMRKKTDKKVDDEEDCCEYCTLLGDKLKDVKCITMNEKFN